MTVLEVLRPLTSLGAQQRGWQYLNHVHALEGDESRAAADVHGGEIYDVEIRLEGRTLRVWCSCPYFADRSSGCKHLWATAVLANENGWLTHLPAGLRVLMDFADADHLPFGVLDEDESAMPAPFGPRHVGEWPEHAPPLPAAAAADEAKGAEGDSLEEAPPRDAPPGTAGANALQPDARSAMPDWLIALNAVDADVTEPPAAAAPGAPLIYVLTAPARATLTELPMVLERRDPTPDGGWARPRHARLRIEDIAHLPDADDRWALSLMHPGTTATRHPAAAPRGLGPYVTHSSSQGTPIGITYLTAPLLDVLLPRLCATGRVRLRRAATHAHVPATDLHDVTLVWDDGGRWQFVLEVTAAEDGYRVDAALVRGDARVRVHDATLVTDTLAVIDGRVARFDPAGGFGWAAQLRSRGPLMIPVASRRALVESLARSAVAHVELPDELRWEERTAPPHFAVTIGAPDGARGACPLTLRVAYGGTETGVGLSARVLSADGRIMYHRDREAERDALSLLEALGVNGLGARVRQRPSIGYRKVAALVHALVEHGWTVHADGVRYRALAPPRIRVRSGIDWFEVDAVGEGDAAIDLPDLLRAARAGRRTVMLGDGTIGMLPEEWLARVAPVLALGVAEAETLRFVPSQVALIDALLAAQPDVDWDEGFERARQAIRRFDGVTPEDPPSSFRGELREYQREALGWMRFLREFGFGGCLADDMGLGKTVMVLAMLDARRTDPARRGPSLVVMPRSLVFNWMSEAARFAPELRVIDFARADRHDALDTLADADVVLTTYGTLRRDVPALQNQSFDYVVLDEAQAIKNAGTATSKAVRLLRAHHRLALTGTPVENHLGELQSLFDFLNPGLLGSGRVLDVPRGIEVESAGQLARVARGLRPFFLRRTKEHVTPELPPRTEETLYCELDGEQRRVYEQLRQHYRQTLLQTVAREGMARSQFQILEALLRLRQAACHTALLPAAVDGESAKFDLLLPRLLELIAEGRKALVFSQFTSLLALLRPLLDAEKVAYEYLDGQTRDREARVARFQQEASCSLFLVSLKAGGVGLNLTAAEYVFLLDPWWNPAVEMQAIDRTHRIGQEKPVFAYRLVARDTVEERILELQSQKRALADAILDTGAGGLRDLAAEELERLLG